MIYVLINQSNDSLLRFLLLDETKSIAVFESIDSARVWALDKHCPQDRTSIIRFESLDELKEKLLDGHEVNELTCVEGVAIPYSSVADEYIKQFGTLGSPVEANASDDVTEPVNCHDCANHTQYYLNSKPNGCACRRSSYKANHETCNIGTQTMCKGFTHGGQIIIDE